MFENIEKARHLLNSGSTRAAIDEFFRIISELEEKDNHEEASRLLLELSLAIENQADTRLLLSILERILDEIEKIDLADYEPFLTEIEKFLDRISIICESRENRLDLVGRIAEVLAKLYENIAKNPNERILEAAKAYGNWAIELLSKPRARVEDEAHAEELIKKAEKLYEKAEQKEGIIDILTQLSMKYLENKNESKAEGILDQAVNTLLKLKLNEKNIVPTTEKVMNNYANFVEFKIMDILNPELPISKPQTANFENSIAVRIIRHAKDICSTRKAVPAISILAKELSLIGLAIFEKGLHEIAIPYFELASDYYLEVGNKEKTIEFGNNLVTLGLQLYTAEKYPIGRDYFNIAIQIGSEVDKSFEVVVYQKQADLFLKYNKFQLAIDAYRQMIAPLKELPDSDLRIDMPSKIRQLARERFEKNDFHYAELMYRLCADFFLEFNQIELAAETLDAAWQPMFKVRNLQTGIDLATKAADAYIKAGLDEEAADVFEKLAEELLIEGHYDIALERLVLAAQKIPPQLHEQKFRPLVNLATKYTELCLTSGDIINARELWAAACDFNEKLSRALIQRDINSAVETIEDHIKNVRKFDNEELNDVTMKSARGSGRVLSEAGEFERAAKIMVSFATDFLRKNLTEYADPLFEEGAAEFNKAKQPEEAARILSALARYHAEHLDFEKSLEYYLKASIDSGFSDKEKIYPTVANHCFETFSILLNEDDYINSEKGFEVAIKIDSNINPEIAANRAYEVAKKFLIKNQFELTLKYYSQSIEGYMLSSKKYAIIVGAETIERGRELFQKGNFIQANNLITLGVETLYRAEQKIQAAQTARIEGERFLTSTVQQFGLTLLNKAIEIYTELKEEKAVAEIHTTMGEYYIIQNQLEQGLLQFKEAGKLYLTNKQFSDLSKTISKIVDMASEIVTGKIAADTLDKKAQEKTGLQFFKVAEDFANDVNDHKLNSDIKHSAWLIFSEELFHDSALECLEKTYSVYKSQNELDKIIKLSNEVVNYSSKLIDENDLLNATKYLNLSIDVLRNVNKFAEAAGICINTCEVFLKNNNYEVAVSWGLRGADILTEVQKINEAMQFLEELAEPLMTMNSIENAILCYGKIAKILEQNNRMKEVEDTALKVMAFGTANMKSNNQEAGLRLWEVALTIGSIVGEEFTGRLCMIEGQTFYEIKDYEKSLELFKESFNLFRRVGKNNRLINLGNAIFDISEELQRNKEYDIAFRILPIAFESMTIADELFLGTEKLISYAKNYIEIDRVKEGNHLINTAIDALFSKKEMAGGVEKCFVGAALLISYGKGSEGGRLIDKGMEKITQITDESAIKHLATVCRNQGIILRDDGKLEASHVILASGIGILRTINDLVGIGQISIDLGKTLVQRNEMNAAVEAYRNGVHLLAQGDLIKESLNIVNELITEGRKQIDNNNTTVGVPLVELAGDLYILLKQPERIMVISEIFINQGGKMLNERNFDVAALYFSKSMELSTKAGLIDYLPKVGNRCIDFGVKLVKEGDPILGIQFMNAGADLITEYEEKFERAGRAASNYLETVTLVLGSDYEKTIQNEEERLELIGQFIDSTSKFLVKIQNIQVLEELSKTLIEYGRKLLKSKGPRIARLILDPALTAANNADNTQIKISIANEYLEHVNYLIQSKKLEHLDSTVNQAVNIYLEVNDHKEIRKFMGIIAQTGRSLCLDYSTKSHGIKLLNIITNLAISLAERDFYPVISFPLIQLNQDAMEPEDIEIMIFARENILKLLTSIIESNLPLSILGNINLTDMTTLWHKTAELLLDKTTTFDQAIKIENQAFQLAILAQAPQNGLLIINEVLTKMDALLKKRIKGVEVLFEIIAVALNGLNQKERVIELGKQCLILGQESADKKRLQESINFLKTAGCIFDIIGESKLISEVALVCASIGDSRLKEDNFKEGLYYYSTALENYELSRDEKSIQIIANTIEGLFKTAPVEDGYICFLVPGMVNANRDKIDVAEDLASQALKQAKKMIKSGRKELIFHSIPYTFAATDIYEQTGNFIEQTKIYDEIMFSYLESISDNKIIELFLDLLIKSILKKLQIWEFTEIGKIFLKLKDQRIIRNKKFNAITNTIDYLRTGKLDLALEQARLVNVLFQRSIEGFINSFKDQVKIDIKERGRISIYDYMEAQPISDLVNVLIEDLYARKEISGKYFQIGLFVSEEVLKDVLSMCDKELLERGKAVVAALAEKTKLSLDEALSVIRIEYIPQKFLATLNEDNTILYSYQQLRSEVENLALGYQDIGNIDLNKISQQLIFPPDTIQREIEYLILEGKINPRFVGRK
ncbi:MAG: hypothetical protein EAX90_12430 [Candidatus Heimdallarchaeota archaeon]|nr:hypothetical protein [Candidatus Heimdallarchaeota archaeon]